MAELTQDEIDFFATGELPPSLLPQATDPVTEEEVAKVEEQAAATTEPKVEPAPVVDPLAELERRLNASFEQRLDALVAKLAPQQAVAEKAAPPDESIDPLGHMMHQLSTINASVTELQTKLSQEQQTNLLKQQFEQFTASVNTQKEAFKATAPDFDAAYAHIRALRTDDLRAAGAPEADIPKILLNDELQLAQTALQRGKNPAAEMYEMAKRYGYSPKAAAAKAAPHLTPEQKMEQLQAGQQAAKNPGKAATESHLTLEGLKDASNADLNKLIQDDRQWAKIMGGTDPDIF